VSTASEVNLKGTVTASSRDLELEHRDSEIMILVGYRD
jgi:hypothetical protein